MNSSNNSTPIECQSIEQLLSNPIYNFATSIQIFIVLVIFICAAILFREYKNAKINFHGNLSLLIFNAIIFNLIHSFCWIANLLRYKYLYFTYSNNCDLLTPVWLAFLLYSSSYFHLIANSTIHFTIMLERIRATLFVRNYECEGLKYGICGVAISWFLSISYTIGVIWSSLADEEMFLKPLGIIIVTSKYNAQPIIYSYYLAMFLSAVTAIGDFWVVQMNKIIQNRNSHHQQKEYSLSRNYQLNENVHSMRLIFPLDFSYAILFGIYMIAGVYLRYSRQSMSNLQYTSYYYTILTLPLLHSAITLIIYIFFIKNLAKKRKTVKVQPLDESGQIYFKKLREQWKYECA